LSSERFKGIWPLPGGITEYVNTLTKILKRIQENNPTYDELLKWFKSEFSLEGEKTPRRYLEGLERWGFLKKTDDKLSLTTESLRFLESRDYKIIYKILSDRILGLDDILLWLSKEALNKDEIHKKLTEKYNMHWRTTAQTYFRLGWLRSLGYVEEKGRKYYITGNELKTVTEEGSKAPPPITPTISPPSPVPAETGKERGILIEPAEVVIDSHEAAEYFLLELGRMFGCLTYTADQAASYKDKRLGEIALLNQIPSFAGERDLGSAREIDVIWFGEDENPKCCFEVEHTTDVVKGLNRLAQLQHLNVKFFIVAEENKRSKFEIEMQKYPYRRMRNRYIFVSYGELARLFEKAVPFYQLKNKLKL